MITIAAAIKYHVPIGMPPGAGAGEAVGVGEATVPLELVTATDVSATEPQ